jgi:predicted transcriptional regulator
VDVLQITQAQITAVTAGKSPELTRAIKITAAKINLNGQQISEHLQWVEAAVATIRTGLAAAGTSLRSGEFADHPSMIAQLIAVRNEQWQAMSLLTGAQVAVQLARGEI